MSSSALCLPHVQLPVSTGRACSRTVNMHGPSTRALIATADADTAEKDRHQKMVSRPAFGKCNGLWRKYGRSALAVEAVNDAFEIGLKRPNATRWNSVYLATERLVCLRLMNEKGVSLHTG